jgi:hypothetical protein
MFHVLAAILMFTFFALAGLVVDLGIVRMSQGAMNAATDTASMEGMRLQDSVSDADRRAAAAALLRSHFDDDFESTAGDPRMFGAGPDVTFTGGTPALAANQTVVVGPQVVFKPNPQLNLGNADHGDMVSGFYDPNDLLHAETPAYLRTDFSTAPQTPDDREAFLVRLRRTNDPNGLDEQPDVSSRGPTLPYLFARGSMMAAPSKSAGVTVRSTSVAAGRPVTMAGIPYLSLGIVGTTPYLLEFDYWSTLAAGTTFELSFSPETSGGGNNPAGGPPMQNPNPTQGGPPIIPPGQLTTGTLEPVAVFADRYDEDRRAWSIGDPVWVDLNFDEDLVLQRLGNPDDPGYVPQLFLLPIYEGDVLWFYDGRPGGSNPPFLPPVNNVPKDDIDPRVVGFGLVEVLYADEVTTTTTTNNGNGNGGNGNNGNGNGGNGGGGGGTTTVTTTNRRIVMRKLDSTVIPRNVSAVRTPGLADLPAWLAQQITALNRSVDEGIQAAALVR